MKRFQLATLVFIIFSLFSMNSIAQDAAQAKCTVRPVISMSTDGQQAMRFSISMDQTELSSHDDIELAIQIACGMQKNNECFYSTECPQ